MQFKGNGRASGATPVVQALESRRLFAGIGSITGVVWNDINRDGLYTPENEPTRGVNNVWADYDNNGVRNGDEPSTFPVPVKDNSPAGYTYTYELTNLALGHYDIRIARSTNPTQTVWLQTSPAGSTDALSAAYSLDLTAAAPAAVANFGVHNPDQRSFIAGTVFHDSNTNGVKDSAESFANLSKVYVDLNGSNTYDAKDATATTDINGVYTLSFYALERNATYRVRPVPIDSVITTTPAAGYFDVTVDAGAGATSTPAFGVVRTPAASVSAFNDLNGDGLVSTGESSYLRDNRTFYLDTDNDGALDDGEPTAIAVANTDYIATFRNLTPGQTYTVRQVLPAGWRQTSPANGAGLTFTAQYNTQPFLKFGQQQTATSTGSISGYAFKDFDRDGVKDAGEPAFADDFIYLDFDLSGGFTTGDRSTTTNANGYFVFDGLAAAAYVVRQNPGTTWSRTTPTTNYGAHVVQVSPGQNVTGLLFGAANNAPGVVSGFVFNDTDADGTLDAGETGMAGVYVFVDYDKDGTADGGEPSWQTSTAGYWEAPVTGDVETYRFAFLNNTGRPLTTAAYYDVMPQAGLTTGGRNFGLRPVVTPPPVTGASVSGNVFDDKNKDGKRALGEGDLANVTVFIDLDGDKVIDAGERSAVTGADGFFEFTGVSNAGSGINTRLRAVIPTGGTQTTPTSNYGYTLNLAPNATNDGKNFGIYGLGTVTPPPTSGASIAGNVFDDKNKNAKKDAGEAGLSGVTVWLDLDGDKIIDASEKTVVTLADGSYALGGLTTTGSSSDTRLRAVAPAGRTQTLPANLYGHTVVLTGTTKNAGKDFGFYGGTTPPPPTATGTITGRLFGDPNKNGVFDAGEAVAPGRQVWLDLDDDGVLDANEPSKMSDSLGVYTFTGLSARTYHVRRVFPSGYVESSPPRYVTIPTNGGTFGNVDIGSKVK